MAPAMRQLANGRMLQAACYRIGPLAHLLKNRFYIGEVVYRGEAHKGEHEPILDLDLFEAVQERLKGRAVERSKVRRSSPALLVGKMFDDRNNPMTPTHANKKGVRYRYYVSHALLQGRKDQAGLVVRVSASDVEELVIGALRAAFNRDQDASDRDLIQKRLDKAIVYRDRIEITLQQNDDSEADVASSLSTISIPFDPRLPLRKGVAHSPTRQSDGRGASRLAADHHRPGAGWDRDDRQGPSARLWRDRQAIDDAQGAHHSGASSRNHHARHAAGQSRPDQTSPRCSSCSVQDSGR